MGTLLTDYVRVDANNRCPICGHDTWCLIARNGRSVICPRTKSERQYKKAGYFHPLAAGTIPPVPKAEPPLRLSPKNVRRHFDRLGIVDPRPFAQHAATLKLPVEALEYFGTRYDGASAALAFPMYSNINQMVGVRFRRQDGKKWSLKGGSNGLFLGPHHDSRIPIIVTEGPTDGAAAVASGFRRVIGRPFCYGGQEELIRYVTATNSPNTPVIILSDPNEVGIEGSRKLAYGLRAPTIVLCHNVDVRRYFITKNTNLLEDVIRAVLGDCSDWKVLFRNMHYATQATTPEFLHTLITRLDPAFAIEYLKSPALCQSNLTNI